MNATATTIRQQIGAWTLLSIGARKGVYDDHGIRWTVGRGRHKVEVRLNGRDLYDITVYRMGRTRYDWTTAATTGDVYAEQLAETLLALADEVGI